MVLTAKTFFEPISTSCLLEASNREYFTSFLGLSDFAGFISFSQGCVLSQRLRLVLFIFRQGALFPFSRSPQTPVFTCAHMSAEAPVRGGAPRGAANMSVPKTTGDNRGIITGQTDYTVQRRGRNNTSHQ